MQITDEDLKNLLIASAETDNPFDYYGQYHGDARYQAEQLGRTVAVGSANSDAFYLVTFNLDKLRANLEALSAKSV